MTERVLVGYDECRCILTQYCDGECRPVFADRALRSVSRATPAVYRLTDADLQAIHDGWKDSEDGIMGLLRAVRDQTITANTTGTFDCPICGKDTPHEHSGDEITAHRNQQKRPSDTADRLADIRDLVADDVHANSFSDIQAYRTRLIKIIEESIVQAATRDSPIEFPYQRTFNAIAAATSIMGGDISVSVARFIEVFNASAPKGDGND